MAQRARRTPQFNRFTDISAPMTDNDTWVECLKCHRTYKTDSIRGLLHFYVAKCNDCVAKEEHHAE